MEETIVRGDLNTTPDLHATIRRLSQQVSDLQQALNPTVLPPSNSEDTMRPSLISRRRRINPSDDRESDDQRSETSKRRQQLLSTPRKKGKQRRSKSTRVVPRTPLCSCYVWVLWSMGRHLWEVLLRGGSFITGEPFRFHMPRILDETYEKQSIFCPSHGNCFSPQREIWQSTVGF